MAIKIKKNGVYVDDAGEFAKKALVYGSGSASIKVNGSYQAINSQSVNIVIFAGQSQSNSNGTNSDGTGVDPQIAGAMTDCYIWDPYGLQWQTYQAGVNSCLHLQGGLYPGIGIKFHGAEAEYCRRWRLKNPGVPLYIVKSGYSTTSLAVSAQTPGRGCWDPTLPAELYNQLKTQFASAKANLIASGKSVSVRNFVWIQGENDASDAPAAAAYATNLSAFIDAVRTDMIGSTAPFVISRIQTSTWTYAATVRAAQESVGTTKANCRWVDADGLPLAADNVHYNSAGVVELGDRVYDAGVYANEVISSYIGKMTVKPNATYTNALTNFIGTLIDKSVYSKLSVLQIYANHTEEAAGINVVDYITNAVTPVNTSMTFTAGQGFTGNGSTSRYRTGFIPSSSDPRRLSRYNASYSIYIRGNITTTGVDMGSFTSTGYALLNVAKDSGTCSFRVHLDGTTANNTTSFLTDVSGLHTIQRSSDSYQEWRQNGTLLKSDAVSPTLGITNGAMDVGNRNGGTSSTPRQYSLYACGAFRTPGQEQFLSDAFVTYLAAVA